MLISAAHYLGRLGLSRRILWCYLVWYLVFAALYFDSSPSLWLSAAGVSVLIGVAFLLGLEPSPRRWPALDGWMVTRLFLIPFCVSSFSALVKGHGFIVVFSPAAAENLLAAGACALFFLLCRVARRVSAGGPAPT